MWTVKIKKSHSCHLLILMLLIKISINRSKVSKSISTYHCLQSYFIMQHRTNYDWILNLHVRVVHMRACMKLFIIGLFATHSESIYNPSHRVIWNSMKISRMQMSQIWAKFSCGLSLGCWKIPIQRVKILLNFLYSRNAYLRRNLHEKWKNPSCYFG